MLTRSRTLQSDPAETERLNARMKTGFGRLVAPRRTGGEQFHVNGIPIGNSLLEFWQWSVSDLVTNANRGIVAEFIVARALGGPNTPVREEWAPVDLITAKGLKIQVKSAAYLQAWAQRTYSRICFSTKAARDWNADTGKAGTVQLRQADVYIFALLAHRDKDTLDPLNVDQWQFYVLPTATLDARKRSQHSITLKSLEGLCKAVKFQELAAAVRLAHQAGSLHGSQ